MNKSEDIRIKEKINKLKQIYIENRRWLILIVFLVIFLFIFEDVMDKEIHIFDNSIYKLLSVLIDERITIFTKFITTLGSAYAIIPICAISIIYFRKKKQALYIPINLITIFIINQVLKRIIQRPRPEGFRIVEEGGYSFPSGHSMVSMAFYGLFIYLIYKNVKNKYIKWISITLLSILIILIGISRIYLGVHYASDVVAGFCLSICYLTIYTKIMYYI